MAYYKIELVESDRLVISNLANPSSDFITVQIIDNSIYDSEKDGFALVLKTIDKSLVTELRNQRCTPLLKVDGYTLISADDYESNKSFDKVEKDDIIEIADWVFKEDKSSRRTFLKTLTTLALPMLLGISTIPVNVSAKGISTSKSCNSGCSGSCSGDCSGSCDWGCSGRCGSACQGGCSSACARACSNCSGSCSNTCANTCKGGCVERCANNCGSTCAINCIGLCERVCTRNCNNGCLGSCVNGCAESCSGKCSGCSGSCLGMCTNTCKFSCSTTCKSMLTY